VNGVVAVVTCPTCGGPLERVNTSQPLAREMTMIVRCTECGAEEGVHVRLVPLVAAGESPAAKRRRALRARQKEMAPA
jgi:endogenous inhibitor of DNA gyrase (YacG/DUF329 family)